MQFKMDKKQSCSNKNIIRKILYEAINQNADLSEKILSVGEKNNN